ncbi:MAG: cytochrome P450 [Actinobacteria bacterium]|nr:cytochrome P450 [Actinomycetota bacterium]
MSTPVGELDLPFVGFGDDRNERLVATLRAAEQSWLARGEIGYTVLRYDDVVAVLRDKRWHSAVPLVVEMSAEATPEFKMRRRESILSAEGDTHVRLRRLVAPAFSPRRADKLRPAMREVVNGLVDRVASSGTADIAADVCEPYPIPIICELLGAPKADWELFSRWATDVLRVFDNNFKVDMPAIIAAQDGLDLYTRNLIADRRSKPRDDLLTDLIAMEEAGDRLTTEELVMMVEAVIVGGTDTTRNQLGLAVDMLIDHPDKWGLLADDPTTAPRFVEETMRLNGAVRATGRVASCDIEYRGVLFPAGSIVFPALASANRDASVFTDPNHFDPTNRDSGQPQLTFGSGIHYCLGAALARAELQEALPLLARRMPNIRRTAEPRYKIATAGVFGPTSLPVGFDPT